MIRCLALLCLIFGLFPGAVGFVAAETMKPNVIFILADDLGYTDLGCFGSRYYETPHLDRMAQEGMRLTAAYTCGPNCQPTRAALMSGQYGPRTGVYTVGSIDRFDWPSRPLRPVDNVTELPLDRVILPQGLKAGGYATGMFGKWHLGEKGEHHPLQRGFDEGFVSMGRHFDFATSPQQEVPPRIYLADYLTDRAVDFIERHKEEPFFLYLPHFGVHSPWEAKPELIEKFAKKPGAGGHERPEYAAMIASVDESVGRIRATLEKLKLSEKTLVIFTSDNGGVGGYRREGIRTGKEATDNAPLHGGKGMLYEGGIRVPYVACRPGTIAAGAESEAPVNSVDLYPTLLEVTGTAAPSGAVLDGTSYAAVLAGKKLEGSRPPLFWHFPGYLGANQNTWRTTPAGAIREGDWKLIEFFEEGRKELYNLREDVGERRDLSAAQPQRVAELYGKLVAWRAKVGAKMPGKNLDVRAPGGKKRGGGE